MVRTIDQALDAAASFLRNLEHPRLEAEALLGSLLNKERAWLKTHDREVLGVFKSLKFKYWISQRRRGMPLAYIRGYQDWHGQKFVVNKSVLIPRDETETLLQHIIDPHPSPLPVGEGDFKILDVGTGSGCLAIELKRAFPDSQVTALDISRKALSVARANAALHGQEVEFKNSDLLSVLDDNSYFDLIVANLPYVPENLVVMKEVQQEPHTAIFSGVDGLGHIKRLRAELDDKKITFGSLWLEFLPSQKDQIAAIFKDYSVEFKADVAGNLFFARLQPRSEA